MKHFGHRSFQDVKLLNLLQGLAAPLFASVALFGGYLLVKNFPALTFQVVLDAYFWLIGSFALAGGLAQPLRRVVCDLIQSLHLFAHPSCSLRAPQSSLSITLVCSQMYKLNCLISIVVMICLSAQLFIILAPRGEHFKYPPLPDPVWCHQRHHVFSIHCV